LPRLVEQLKNSSNPARRQNYQPSAGFFVPGMYRLNSGLK
jgi:hypothetical protein